jgi:cytochrome c oxidase subunit II
MISPVRRILRAVVIAVLASLHVSCGDRSIFDPASPGARLLSWLGWFVLITFLVTTAVMWVLIVVVARRRRGTLAEHAPPDAEGGLHWVLIGGFAIPAAVLATIFVLTLQTMSALPVHAPHGAPDIVVRGQRWWFEVQYRIGSHEQWVTTATEIHVPVGEPVQIALESRDVIHSFWVPELHGKVDLVPGMTNHIRLQADVPGRFGGQCAEFCGKQHAKMRLAVVAEPREQFDRWLAAQRQPAALPSSPSALRGRELFERGACALCHTVRGTPALGTVGPDLTHLAGRETIAGGSLANTTANLHAWIVHAQSLKPGAQMPDLTSYTGAQLHDLVAYMQDLR